MTEWLEVNGAKIEKKFLEENIAEAKTYKWEQSSWDTKCMDHTHCIICTKAIPDKSQQAEEIYYKSKGGWLCSYCYNRFLKTR